MSVDFRRWVIQTVCGPFNAVSAARVLTLSIQRSAQRAAADAER